MNSLKAIFGTSVLERIIRLRWWILIFLAIIAFTIFAGDFRQDPTTAILAATLRHSTPLVLGALCGMLCERAGVVNIGIEGQMLMSAFVGFTFYFCNIGANYFL